MTATTTSTNVEYCLLNYVPNVLSDKSVSIAAIVFPPGDVEAGVCAMIYAADWRARVRVLDPDADLEVLEALLSDIRDRLLSPSHCSDMIHQLEDSFSNIIQVSLRRQCMLDSSPNAIETFARGLLEKTSKLWSSLSSTQASTCEATL